jgi:hypothetical protein
MKYFLVFLILIFSFFLFADSVSPYVTPLYPLAGSNGIPVDSDVTFRIFDDIDGVDIQSVEVDINGITYTSNNSSFFYSGTIFSYIITINPPMDFQFDDLINIQIDASDLEVPANVMQTYSYSFQTIEDMQPPYIGGLDPEPGAVNIPQETDIGFTIYDSGIGVNLTSIVVVIQGVSYTHNDELFYYYGNTNEYHILINVPINFELAEIVEVSIDASDLNGISMATFEYSFEIIGDMQPPYTGEWNPEHGEDEVPIETNISFNVYDNIEGVDITSIIVDIQGIQFTHLNTSFTYQTIPNGYTVTLDLLNNFDFGEIVTVQIDAADLSQPANLMITYMYSFQCAYDISPPYTGNYDPIPGQQNAPINTNINFHVYDDDLGVDINTLLVDIDGVSYSIANGNLSFSGNSADYLISINPTENFEFSQLVTVEIDVADIAIPPNQLSGFSYSFQCISDNEAPYVTDIDPQAYSVDNPLNTNISFHIIDEGFGVDINTVVVNVQSIPYSVVLENLFYSGTVNDYLIIIDPIENFNSGDIVYISIDASDMVIPANQMETFSYSFQCISDNETPYITNLDPQAYSVDNLLNTNISFHIIDEGFGVDINTVVVNVQSIPYSVVLENLFYSGTVNDYLIIIDPIENFNSGDTVYVSIDASDMVIPANQMETFNYSFECIFEDVNPPFIWQPNPANDAVNISVFTPISCYILDNDSDVDPTSIEMNINNIAIEDFELEEISIMGKLCYIISYQSSQPFNYNEIITVNISAADLAIIPNLLTDATFSFECEENQPATITLPDSFVCEEDGLIIENFNLYIVNPLNDDLSLEVVVSNNLSITIDGFIVSIQPDQNWFGTENVSFIIRDEMGEPIASDNTNIVVSSVNDAPSFNADLFPEEITFTENTEKIIDFAPMISDPEQLLEELTLTITGSNDVIIDITDFIVTFSALVNWIGSEVLTVTLEDNVSRLSCSTELVVTVTSEEPDEKILIEPHTVKWDDDCCEITILSQVDLGKISGKIFNKSGKLIKKLIISEYGDRKQTSWDKRDSNQNLVSGGFYIYQIIINKRIYQGSIIIVR